jgi:hypothetical protein
MSSTKRVWLVVTANVVPSSPIPVPFMMEAISSYETSVLTRATWLNISEEDTLQNHCCENFRSNPEDGILHGRRRENLKAYMAFNRLDSVTEK